MRVPIKPQDSNIEDMGHGPIRLGVIRGGRGADYDVSLKTGDTILKKLRETGESDYKVFDILVDKNDVWHVGGREVNPQYLKDHIDLAWIAMHGESGQNGHVQAMLEELMIPYLGADPISSELTYHRGRMKKRLADIGLQTPKHFELLGVYTGDMNDEDERRTYIESKAVEVFRAMPGPWTVKPLMSDFSNHNYVAKNYQDLVTALSVLSRDVDDVLVEEYMQGREVSSGVVEGLRDQERYTVPVHEYVYDEDILPPEKKMNGDYDHVPMHRTSKKMKDLIHEMAETLHDEFGMKDYSMSEFRITPKGIYVTEIDSHPPLHDDSQLLKSLDAVGISVEEFILHQLERLKKKGKN
jgi:D-alanine-D-alanine ligase